LRGQVDSDAPGGALTLTLMVGMSAQAGEAVNTMTLAESVQRS
jgi:hypothetical protein